MIRVLIVDPHDLVRVALENRLATAVGLDIISGTSEYEDAIQKAQRLCPDVILLEPKAPGGMEVLKKLTQTLPQSAFIILTSYLDSHEEDAALQLGAARCLLKTLNTKELVREIRASARQHHDTVPPPITATF